MKRFPQGYALIIWMCVGIVVATVAANQLFASGLVSYQVLYQQVQQGWQSQPQNRTGNTIQIVLIRLFETGLIGIICRRAEKYHRKTGIYLLLCYTGIVTGLSVVLLTWSRGVVGIFCCIVASLPHYLFYAAAWGIMILRVEVGGGSPRKRFWSVVIIILIMGILSEIWLNPYLLRFV